MRKMQLMDQPDKLNDEFFAGRVKGQEEATGPTAN